MSTTFTIVTPPLVSGMNQKAARRVVRSFSVAEKLAAIERVHNGESKAAVARDLCVPESTLRGWCKSEDKLKGNSTRHSSGSPNSLSEDVPLDFSSKERVSPPVPRLISISAIPVAPHSPPVYPDWRHEQHSPSLPGSPKEAGIAESGSWFWKWYKAQGLLDQIDVKKRKFNTATDELEDAPATAAEALYHAEKLMKWLEICSEPSVTAMQILQFRSLLNNIKDCTLRQEKNPNQPALKIRRRK